MNVEHAEFCPKYDHLPKRQLKRAFGELKSKNNDLDNHEIRYVSKLIQRKYARKEDNQQPNHDEKITSNFWGYRKKHSKKKKMKLNQILIKKHLKHIFKIFSNSVIPTKHFNTNLDEKTRNTTYRF